ncbi:prepilin-type N-terminal cleavage/methylation domain-containing protein, partial [bacterium]
MNSRKGFTLVELMVVVAIIGVLGTVLLPQVTGLVEKAKASKIVSLVDTLRTACSSYYSDVGTYPNEYSAPTYLGAANHRLSIAQPTISAWAGPYLHTILSRADNPYVNTILVYAQTNNWATAAGAQGFDLDGDGTVDTTTNQGNFVVFYAIPTT